MAEVDERVEGSGIEAISVKVLDKVGSWLWSKAVGLEEVGRRKGDAHLRKMRMRRRLSDIAMDKGGYYCSIVRNKSGQVDQGIGLAVEGDGRSCVL